MTTDHPDTYIISGDGLVTALEAQSSRAVVQRGSTVIAERMFRSSGEHDVFAEIYPIFYSFFGAHCYTLKLSMAFGVSG